MPLVRFEACLAAVQAGAVISFPTDTVPALASLPQLAERIYELKQRSLDKPLILMGAEIEQLWPYLAGRDEERQRWRQLMERHWPGALTLVLPASDQLPKAMNPQDPTSLGVRIPDCAIARDLLRQTGPLATTSANRSGAAALLEMGAIAEAFPTVAVLAADPSVSASGLPSTVVRWTDPGAWQVLRQGVIRLGPGE
jgi:L-threonylcarbamoyladenylate synthase